MPVDINEIDNVVAAVEKEYGTLSIHKGSEAQKVPRIPYPSLELNIATGGGAPIGRISRWFGNYSSGKTLNCLNLIKNAQNLNLIAEQFLESEYDEVKRRGEELLKRFPDGLVCAYYNVEGVYDKDFAEQVGVDTEKLYVVEGSTIEPLATILEASLGAIHVHVVDSVSHASSIDEVNSDMTDWHRAIKARVWNKVLDHWYHHLDRSDNAIILIDQVRVNQLTGAEEAPGGKKLEHVSSQTIQFKRGKWLYNREGILKPEAPKKGETIHGSAEADGFEIQARVTKSRVGRPLRMARMQIDFNGMKYNQEYELAKAAEYFGVVERSGSWFTLPDGSKVQGEKGLRNALEENVDLKKKTIDEIDLYTTENP